MKFAIFFLKTICLLFFLMQTAFGQKETLPFNATKETIAIADPVLKAQLLEDFDQNEDGELDTEEAQAVIILRLREGQIHSLSGIEQLPRLHTLLLKDLPLSSLEEVSACTGLTSLAIQNIAAANPHLPLLPEQLLYLDLQDIGGFFHPQQGPLHLIRLSFDRTDSAGIPAFVQRVNRVHARNTHFTWSPPGDRRLEELFLEQLSYEGKHMDFSDMDTITELKVIDVDLVGLGDLTPVSRVHLQSVPIESCNWDLFRSNLYSFHLEETLVSELQGTPPPALRELRLIRNQLKSWDVNSLIQMPNLLELEIGFTHIRGLEAFPEHGLHTLAVQDSLLEVAPNLDRLSELKRYYYEGDRHELLPDFTFNHHMEIINMGTVSTAEICGYISSLFARKPWNPSHCAIHNPGDCRPGVSNYLGMNADGWDCPQPEAELPPGNLDVRPRGTGLEVRFENGDRFDQPVVDQFLSLDGGLQLFRVNGGRLFLDRDFIGSGNDPVLTGPGGDLELQLPQPQGLPFQYIVPHIPRAQPWTFHIHLQNPNNADNDLELYSYSARGDLIESGTIHLAANAGIDLDPTALLFAKTEAVRLKVLAEKSLVIEECFGVGTQGPMARLNSSGYGINQGVFMLNQKDNRLWDGLMFYNTSQTRAQLTLELRDRLGRLIDQSQRPVPVGTRLIGTPESLGLNLPAGDRYHIRWSADQELIAYQLQGNSYPSIEISGRYEEGGSLGGAFISQAPTDKLVLINNSDRPVSFQVSAGDVREGVLPAFAHKELFFDNLDIGRIVRWRAGRPCYGIQESYDESGKLTGRVATGGLVGNQVTAAVDRQHPRSQAAALQILAAQPSVYSFTLRGYDREGNPLGMAEIETDPTGKWVGSAQILTDPRTASIILEGETLFHAYLSYSQNNGLGKVVPLIPTLPGPTPVFDIWLAEDDAR